MARWSAPSDRDYDDHDNGLVERTCRQCGGTVLVSRAEPYQLHVHCDRCIRETTNRAAERSPLTDHLFDTGILLARMGR